MTYGQDANTPEARSETPRRRGLPVLIVATLTSVAGLALWGLRPLQAAKPDTVETVSKAPETSQKPADDSVKLQESQLKNIRLESVELKSFRPEKLATGRITFNEDRSTPVFSPYAGRVLKLFAQPGDTVAAGDPLFEIDTPDLVQAESDLIAAAGTLKKSQTALTLARRSEGIAQRNIVTAQRSLDLARRNEARQKDLYSDKAVALKDWEQAERDAQQAERDLEQAHKDLEQAQSDMRSAESDITTNETALAASRDHLRVFGKDEDEISKIEQMRVIDRVTRVKAPIGGTITSRKVGLGQYIRADNSDPLFTITELGTMWMVADVTECDIPKIALGSDVEVCVMAWPGERFHGKVGFVSPSVDPTTRRVNVRCVVDNASRKLKAEMFANFRIAVGESTATAAVPAGAIVRDGSKTNIWVADGANRFVRREVETGIEQDGLVQVLCGLKPGDQIAADSGLFLNAALAK